MDREKVIKGLEHCLALDSPCGDCPYYSYEDIQELDCERNLRHDALALLKEDCHNCKLECLLQKYDQLKEKYDALLKEHEAVDPRPAIFDIYKSAKLYHCSICGELIVENQKYCHECGQAVKWE